MKIEIEGNEYVQGHEEFSKTVRDPTPPTEREVPYLSHLTLLSFVHHQIHSPDLDLLHLNPNHHAPSHSLISNIFDFDPLSSSTIPFSKMYMAYGWPQVIPMESGLCASSQQIVYLKIINRLLLVVSPTHLELWSSSQVMLPLSSILSSFFPLFCFASSLLRTGC